jgi:hypothetical protein
MRQADKKQVNGLSVVTKARKSHLKNMKSGEQSKEELKK